MKRRNGFLCYAHCNGKSPSREFVTELTRFLNQIRPEHDHQAWSDQNIRAGDDWPAEIRKALDRAAYAVLFVNIELLDSEFVQEVELPALLEAAQKDGLLLLALRVTPCPLPDWLARIQFSNHGETPLDAARRTTRHNAYTAVWERVTEHLAGSAGPSQGVRLMGPSVPVCSAGAMGTFANGAVDEAPLTNAVLTDVLSRQTAKEFARIRERYLKGHHAAATTELDELLDLPGLTASLRGRLLRTAALYRLSFAHDQAVAEALAERAAEEDPGGDGQALAAYLALRRGDKESAWSFLAEPRSRQARHLKAAMLIEDGEWEAALDLLNVPFEPAERGAPDGTLPVDVADSAGNTAETWRLRALAHLSLKRLPDAVEAIGAARALAPDWVSVRSAAAVVEFWRACTPAALTLSDQPLWPMPFAPALVRASHHARLRQIAQTFAAVAEALSDDADEQGHWLTWQMIALLAAGDRRDESTALAERLLSDERVFHPWPLVWVRFFDLDVDRGRLKQCLTAVPPEDPNFLLLRGLGFEMQLEDGEGEAVLEQLDDSASWVGQGRSEFVVRWRIAALTSVGRFDEAEVAADALSDERVQLRSRLLIARARDPQEPGSYKEAAAALFAVDPDLDVLAEACDVHARAEDWRFVAAHGDTLLEAIPTPGSLRLLAFAAFNLGDYPRCLGTLDDHRDVFPDGRLPRDLAVLRVRCQRMSGDVSQAAREARLLFEQVPSAEHLVELLNAQLEGADRSGMLDSLRRMQVIEDADGDLLLQGVRIALQLDRDLAISLWRKAVSKGSNTPDFPTQAATLGSGLGLRNEETGPWFRRMAEHAAAGVGSARMFRFPEVLEVLREQREAADRLRDLHRQGDLPVHGLFDSSRLPLAVYHHDLPVQSRADPDPLRQEAILIRHGARPRRHLDPRRDGGYRLVLDPTALITAQSLGLLDLVESRFAPLLIPRQWHFLLREDIERLRPSQPQRSAAAEQIAQLVRSGGIERVDLGTGPTPLEGLSSLLGERQARELAMVDSIGGYLLTYLPLHGPDLEKRQVVDLPPGWASRVLGPRAMLDLLLAEGVIEETEHKQAISDFSPEPAGSASAVQKGSALLVSPTLLEQLAEVELLNVVSHYFRLSVPLDEWRGEEQQIRQAARSAELIRWIESLIERVHAGLHSGLYRLVPGSAPDDVAESPHMNSLQDLLAREGQPGDLLWVDDRQMNGYPRTGATLIVGVVEVLDLLVGAGASSHARRFEWLHQLRASNYRFIPLEADEILHWLGRSHIHSQALRVPHQLATIARYWSACLYPEGTLRFRNDPRHPTGESLFFVSSQRAVDEAIRITWSDPEPGSRLRHLRADWLLDNLYLGLADVTHLLPDPGPERDTNLIGVDLATLVFGAFEQLLGRGSEDGKGNAKRRMALAKNYLVWVCERIVAPRLQADPAALGPTAAHIRRYVMDVFGKDDSDQFLRTVGAWMLKLMPILPRALRTELHKDQSFMQRIGLAEVAIAEIGGRRVAATDFWSAVEAAMKGEARSVRDLDRREPLGLRLFSGSGDTRPIVELTDEKGRSLGQHYLPYSELLSEDHDLRLGALRRNPHWWDGASANYEALERELVAISPAEARMRRVDLLATSSADSHYLALQDQSRHDKGMYIDRCLPPTLSAVLTYIRCAGDLADGQRFAEKCWETFVQSIPASRGLVEPLGRIALLPCPLPDAVHKSIGALQTESRRELLKRASSRMVHPVGHLHLVDLFLAAAGTLPEALGLAQEQIAYLSTPHFAEELKLVRTLVDLAYRAFGTQVEDAGIEPRRQLLAAWAHAGRVTNILRWAGVDLGQLATMLDRWAPFPYRDLYAEGAVPMADLAWPSHVGAVDLVFVGLGRVLSQYQDLVRQLDLSDLQARLARIQTNSPDLIEDLLLLRDPGLLTDTLGCLWGGDRSTSLLPLIGAEKASRYAPDAFSSLVDELLKDLSSEPGNADPWYALWLTVRDERLPVPAADCLDKILSRLDMDALIASNHLLLKPLMDLAVRHRSNREAVAALILRWAEGVDAGELPSPAFREGHGADAVRLFNEHLLGWLHGLAIRHPEDPDAEFAHLLDELILRSRTWAAELRGSLTNLIRRFPFSRHRALHRSLLAARARPELAPLEAQTDDLAAKKTARRKNRKKRGKRSGRRNGRRAD